MQQEKTRGSIDIMHEAQLIKALLQSNASKKKTALLLGVTERTVTTMMIKYNIIIAKNKAGLKTLQKQLGELN